MFNLEGFTSVPDQLILRNYARNRRGWFHRFAPWGFHGFRIFVARNPMEIPSWRVSFTTPAPILRNGGVDCPWTWVIHERVPTPTKREQEVETDPLIQSQVASVCFLGEFVALRPPNQKKEDTR